MKRSPSLSESLRVRHARMVRRAARGAWGLAAWSFQNDSKPSARRTGAGRKHSRRGSTLLVVMALLGMLTLLGMLYFTFASQELANANNFAEAAKILDDPGDDIEAIFNEAIKQLLQGANATTQPNSSLTYRHSMLGTLFGNDLQPYSGTGVNLTRTSTSGLFVDQNRDGTADSSQAGYNLLEPNDSPAVQRVGVPALFQRKLEALPAGDVDHTYPDINNMFLAYRAYTWDFTVTPPRQILVIKPSFHRPELLRNPVNFAPVSNWYSVSGAGGRLFRPHPEHHYVWRQPSNLTPERRFLDASNVTDAAIIATLPGLSGGYPFQKDLDGDGVTNEQGVWDRLSTDPNSYDDVDVNSNGTFDAGDVDYNGNGTVDKKPYEYDVDTDGDGVNDAIYMDLDLPLLVRPSDNATYVPLIAFQVLDLDALLNLNIHGNSSGDTRGPTATTNFGNGQDISRSSQGLGPHEVNPTWALDTAISEAGVLTDHNTYFAHNPATSRELANMELFWRDKGRIEFTSPRQIHPGRYGEANRLWQVLAGGGSAISVQQTSPNLFPMAGYWDVDDNRDEREGGELWLGGSTVGTTQTFVHPLALGGLGRYLTGNPKRLNLIQAVGGNPCTWLRYDGIRLGYDPVNNVGNAQWLNPFAGALMTNYTVGANFGLPLVANPMTVNDYALVDDPLEITLDSKYLQRPYDEPLETSDSLWMFMSNADRVSTGLSSRIRSLMPGNFDPGTPPNPQQINVAHRFTTDSWDLKQYGMQRFIGGAGPDGLPGVASFDDNRDGTVDDVGELGYPGSDDDRAWEFNVDSDRDGLPEFPPQFNPNPANNFQPDPARPENAFGNNNAVLPAYHVEDPFRPQLRRLLTTEFGNTSDIQQHAMRLSINEFLDVERLPNQAGDPYTGPLLYRVLTPHSTDTTLTTIPAVSPLPAYPPTTEGEKEFWARRDRQQMARDIYVMLYTFCGGNDSSGNAAGTIVSGNVTTRPGFAVHSYPMRRQMAQFAVNLVDSLDRDNVITAFEFDHNLLNGWNLDDDFTTNEQGTMQANERDVVFGVEAQELTFSEVLWVHQPMGADHTLTPFSEATGENNFLQIELRSIKPENLPLVQNVSTTASQAIWRIHRDDNRDGIVDAAENAMAITKGTTIGSSPVPPTQLTPGQLYTIASADVSTVGSASLYVDTTAGLPASYELQAPNTGGPAYPATPLLTEASLDLDHADHNGYSALTNGTTGDFLSRNNNPSLNPSAQSPTTAFLRLERRLNPYLVQLPVGINPFEAVDFVQVSRQNLNINAAITTQAMAAAQLANVRSRERRQPLDGNGTANSTGSGTTPLLSTLSTTNSNSPTPFGLFQSHFDRDFASVVELFEVPLQGPNGFTRNVVNSRRPASLAPNLGQLENGGPSSFGGAVLLQTESSDVTNTLAASEDVIGNGVFNGTEDANGNSILDSGEDLNVNGMLDVNVDTNGNGALNFGNDLNNNGVLDGISEDLNGNGVFDMATEDLNTNGAFEIPRNPPNHFHRLLSLVEVPTRTHRQLGNPLLINRVPGKIAINTLRDPRVLAGLIDDRQIISAPERDINSNGVLDAAEDLNGNGQWDYGLLDAYNEDLNGNGLLDLGEDVNGNGALDGPETARDWFFNFLAARDGIDPISVLPLPVSGVSRPFRDLGALQPAVANQTGKSSLEDTILRQLPISANGRRLFELATDGELAANPTNTAASVDPLVRHRILSKIIGNTTTRSNVFVVFATIGMFECKELANGAVRIGGQIDVDGDSNKDTHRAVFIIDRSTAEDAYDKGSGTFDWKKLVKARQRVN